MKAAPLNLLDFVPAESDFFPKGSDLSRLVASLLPSGGRRSKDPSTSPARSRSRRIVEDPVAQARIAELFALKRDDKPPENFIRTSLELLHRRNALSMPDDKA